jgi:hypothetical protein
MIQLNYCSRGTEQQQSITHSLFFIFQMISLLVSKPHAAKSFAKQLGWQESLVKLLIFRSYDDIPVNNDDLEPSPKPVAKTTENDNALDTVDSVDNTGSGAINNALDESSVCQAYDSAKLIKHPENLDLFYICDTTSMPSPKSPLTPFYLNHIDDFDSSSEDLRLRSMSRSSTASLEDISNGRRSQDRLSQISGFSVNGAVDMSASITSIGDSRRSSGIQNEQLQQALENLGIQSYLKEGGEKLEEVCQNIVLILLMVMTKGVEGSSSESWKVSII